jgi:hypothetical protein
LRLGRRQWTGVLVTAIGLSVLGLTTAPIVRQHASAAALIAVEGAVVALSGVLITASSRLEPLDLRKGIILGAPAGGLFGTSDIAIKHLAHPALSDPMLLLNPWTLSALIAMVVAFYASARSLQLGPAIQVIMFTSLTGNAIALLGGILVFHDDRPHPTPDRRSDGRVLPDHPRRRPTPRTAPRRHTNPHRPTTGGPDLAVDDECSGGRAGFSRFPPSGRVHYCVSHGRASRDGNR